ncbi:hypothetical protein ACKKBG_A05140 [Auxenochlorella protothecoides x Auxenochlorella symbiontica]
MQSAHRRGKKRKPEADLEAERSLYASFATAANSVSQLYSLALGQQARYRDEGARQSLERVYEWLCKEHGNSSTLPTAALMDFLRQEALLLGTPGECSAAPVPVLPLAPPAVFSSAAAAAKEDEGVEGGDKGPAAVVRRLQQQQQLHQQQQQHQEQQQSGW